MAEAATTNTVLAGSDRWSCERADCLGWLSALPDDSVDLLFTSPPYMGARTYGIGFDMDAEGWTAWMVQVVRAASPKVKGLIAVVCEGRTEDYRYQPAPFLLAADLHRAGFNLRKPCVYERDGIPGSGGPDWLKNRWEPILCVTRPGRLPWSDNTACGHQPRYGRGGVVSHRSVNGDRFNVPTRRAPDGKRGTPIASDLGRPLPDLSNPGNVIGCGADTHLGLGNENEAPFPPKLVDLFVLSFCPPGGVVADCFAGSGTTLGQAVGHGRRAIGCDVRQSQVDLAARRMRSVTPALPGVADA